MGSTPLVLLYPDRPALSRRMPRIVFFGPPASGKSKLIEAFTRSAASSPQPTEQGNSVRSELIAHPIQVKDSIVPGGGVYVLIDCDGEAVDRLLEQGSLEKSTGALGSTVISADALVLVVDATDSAEEIEQLFTEFKRFLKLLVERREFRCEVGGLPVFLTLTKCDALHIHGDAPTDWQRRIEQRKDEINAAFQDFFDQDDDPFLEFGSIEVQLEASSTSLTADHSLAIYREPAGTYGVSDLVSHVLNAARNYRERGRKARRRLGFTITASLVLVTGMLAASMWLISYERFTQPKATADLIRIYRDKEPPAAVRLSDRQIARTTEDLKKIEARQDFPDMADDLKDFVRQRLRETDVYWEYRKKFVSPRLGPAELDSSEQCRRLDADLQTVLAPPPEFTPEWDETDAVRLRKKWIADLALLRSAEERLYEWHWSLIRRATLLLETDRPFDLAWRDGISALIADSSHPPFSKDSEIVESPSVPVKRGGKLKYAAVFRLDDVVGSERDWTDSREKLLHARDLCDALGLSPTRVAAVLELPEPTLDGAGSGELAALRMAALRVAYPTKDYPNSDYPEWNTAVFPDRLRNVIDERLRRMFETGCRHVRKILTLKAGTDWASRKDLKRTLEVLADSECTAWGRLLRLPRLWTVSTSGTDVEKLIDPVAEIAEFLKRDAFEMAIPSVTIAIPNDLFERRPTPGDNSARAWSFTLEHVSQSGVSKKYAYELKGKGDVLDPTSTTFTFIATGHDGNVNYRPGETLTAVLTLWNDDREYHLTWAEGSPTYQFARLSREPKITGPSTEPAAGVRLSVPAPGNVPRVPAIHPDASR